MKATITKTELKVAGTLPPGVYAGSWGGYVITIRLPFETYLLHTAEGIRCPDWPVRVTVSADYQISVESTGNPS